MLETDQPSRLSVFDLLPRTDKEPKKRSESRFEYLNRSDTLARERMCGQIDRWYAEYPDDGRHELRQRFRSGNDRDFDSALHELVLHALAKALRCELRLHPDLQGSSKHPDFILESSPHCNTYLEAVNPTDLSPEEEGAEKRKGAVLDGLDDLDMQDFGVGITQRRTGKQPLSQKRLRSRVKEILQSLDPATLADKLSSGGIEALPRFSLHEDDWELELTVMPKSTPGGRLIGIEMTEVHKIDTTSPLRARLKRKAGRYGELNLPYI